MIVGPRTAVSLYVALAVHVLLLLGLALSAPPQDPVGRGLGLSVPGAGLDPVERRMATEPLSDADRGSRLAAAGGEAPQARAGAATPVRIEPDLSPHRPRASRAKADRHEPATSRAEEGDAAVRAGRSGGGGEAGYFAQLRTHLALHRRELPGGLPAAMARVRFRVAPDGAISELELFEGSGLAALDAEAMDLLRRAAPLPSPPGDRAIRLIVPVSIGETAQRPRSLQ